MTDLNLPPELADVSVGDLTPDQLLALLEASAEGGIRLAFSGKQAARQIARRVRPRTLTTVKSRSFGSIDEVGKNLLIEGDNLQSMVTLYKYRGQVDLILTDPPYNTGKDFVYPDNFQDNIQNYLELTGQVEGGRKIRARSKLKCNTAMKSTG